jgi:hypothetical protein
MRRLRQNAESADSNAAYNKQLQTGDMVRVDILAFDAKLAAQRKQHAFKASHQAAFLQELY